MMRIAIIGAGLSGLACADHLVLAGHAVSLFDKARGPGGRMSTRRIDSAAGQVSFDHGAQYFTARDPAFQAVVSQWQDSGSAARWPAAGPEAWVGVPAMNAPIKMLAAQHDVSWSTPIDELVQQEAGWRLSCDTAVFDKQFEAVVMAIPAEQAAALLASWDKSFHRIAANTTADPCWTLMLAFPEPLETAKMAFRDDAIIGWAARNSDKPGRAGPDAWVIQASPTWSKEHLEDDPHAIVAALSARFASLIDIPLPEPLIASAHRWRYARSGKTDQKALYSKDLKIGVCGDWLIGPRVECAWRSGTALARMILA